MFFINIDSDEDQQGSQRTDHPEFHHGCSTRVKWWHQLDSGISESPTEDISGMFTIETTFSSEKDLSATSVCQREILNKRIREQAYSAKCAVDLFDKIKKVKDIKEPSKELNSNQTFLQKQEKLYWHQIHHKSNQHIQEQLNRIIHHTQNKQR